jgi:hypothetical protein
MHFWKVDPYYFVIDKKQCIIFFSKGGTLTRYIQGAQRNYSVPSSKTTTVKWASKTLKNLFHPKT